MRHLARQLTLCVVLVGQSWAAPDCNDPNAVESHVDSPSTSISISYTTRSGSNQVSFMGVGGRSLVTSTPSSPAHGGNAMTQIGTTLFNVRALGAWFRLPNPPAGTNNFTATWSASLTNGNYVVFTCNDVDVADPIRSSAEGTGLNTTPSSTPATVDSADTVLDYFTSDSQATITVGANQTEIHSGASGSSSGGASYQAGSAGGAMTWTTDSDEWTSHSASLKSAPVISSIGGNILWFQ